MDDSFKLDLDETYFILSDGVLNIVGDKERDHQINNVSDLRIFVIFLRVGNAASLNEPIIYPQTWVLWTQLVYSLNYMSIYIFFCLSVYLSVW